MHKYTSIHTNPNPNTHTHIYIYIIYICSHSAVQMTVLLRKLAVCALQLALQLHTHVPAG